MDKQTQNQQLPQTDVKCRFFAQYFEFEAIDNNDKTKTTVKQCLTFKEGFIDNYHLELKAILNISDEDALKAVDLLGNSSHLSEESRIFQFKKLFESPTFWVNQTNIPLVKMLKVFDFLRSKGYSLPFMEYSVENLISFGWVRLV